MVGQVRLHGSDHAQVVGRLGCERKELAHVQPACAVFLERERRWKGRPGLALGAEADRNRFARPFFQQGFGIEAIELGGTAVHEEVDHPFGPGCKVRLLEGQRRSRRLSDQ